MATFSAIYRYSLFFQPLFRAGTTFHYFGIEKVDSVETRRLQIEAEGTHY